MIHRIRLLLLLSAAFIALAAHNAFAAQGEIIVAKSGGQFTSIQAAINSVTPTASNPYVIKVMPGTYAETVRIDMKPYLSLQGSGYEVTTIQSPSSSDNVVTIIRSPYVAVSGFTITGGDNGIYNNDFDPLTVTVSNNRIVANQHFAIKNDYNAAPIIRENLILVGSNDQTGILTNYSLTPAVIQNNIIRGSTNWIGGMGVGILNYGASTITGNSFSDLGGGIRLYNASAANAPITITANNISGCSGYAIENQNNSSPVISGNTMTNNGMGIRIEASSPVIIGNSITGGYNPVLGQSYSGVSTRFSAAPTIVNNKITAHQQDVYVESSSTPNISLNIYDTITGTTGVGLYNVKSDGTPAPAP